MVRPHPPRGRVVRTALLLSLAAVCAFPTVAAAQTTLGEPVATEAPTELTPLLATLDDASVTLTWLDAQATGYTVERSADAGETFEVLAEVEGAVLTYVDEDVAPGSYLYRVVAAGADPAAAPTVPVEIPEVVDPLPTEPTEPPPSEPPPPTPKPDPDPVDPDPDTDVVPPKAETPELPEGNGPAGHGVQAPALPKGSSDDPHNAQPRAVRSAGAALEPLTPAERLRLFRANQPTGMTTVTLPLTVGPPGGSPVAAPPRIHSIPETVMPTGPVVAVPPVPTELTAGIPVSEVPVSARLLPLAFALLGAIAAAHAVRPIVARVAGPRR